MGIIHCNVLRKERSPSFMTESGLGMIISKMNKTSKGVPELLLSFINSFLQAIDIDMT